MVGQAFLAVKALLRRTFPTYFDHKQGLNVTVIPAQFITFWALAACCGMFCANRAYTCRACLRAQLPEHNICTFHASFRMKGTLRRKFNLDHVVIVSC